MGGRDIQAAKGGGVFTRWGGYGPGVAEGGLGRDVFGPRGGKGYLALERKGCPRSAEGARFRLNIGETSVTSRRSFREDFARIAHDPRIISIARRAFIYNYKFSSGVNSIRKLINFSPYCATILKEITKSLVSPIILFRFQY